MVAEHEAVQLVGELVRVEVLPEVALVDGDARRGGERVQPVAHGLDQRVARRAGPVVQLAGGSDEHAAARAVAPAQPGVEEGAHARLAARPGQRLDHDLLDELPRRLLDDLHLQGFLGAEVREQAALGQLELLGQAADGQALEPDHRGQGGGPFDDRLPGGLAFAHAAISCEDE